MKKGFTATERRRLLSLLNRLTKIASERVRLEKKTKAIIGELETFSDRVRNRINGA